MSLNYPPAPAVLTGDNLSASRFLANPQFVARRMQTLGDLRYVGGLLLTGRQPSIGGAVGYNQVEGIFADKDPEVIAPGGEYTLTTISDGPAGLARVAKYGEDTIIDDESIKRRAMDPVEKAMLKLVNSAGRLIDTSVISVIASAVTQAQAVTAGKWDTATPAVLLDVLLAVSKITGQNLGYAPNALVVSDRAWAYLAASPVIAGAMAREDRTNPIYTGRFSVLAGLEVIPVPTASLPGGVETNAWVVDRAQLGFIATEDLGGGYTSAGDLVETKVIRQEENDGWRLRVRSVFAPVVTDPLAGCRITGIL